MKLTKKKAVVKFRKKGEPFRFRHSLVADMKLDWPSFFRLAQRGTTPQYTVYRLLREQGTSLQQLTFKFAKLRVRMCLLKRQACFVELTDKVSLQTRACELLFWVQ